MTNKFTITITAVDKATAMIKGINDRVSRMFRPLERMGRSVNALGRELGLPKMAKNLKAVGGHAKAVVGHLAPIVGALGVITGLATVGGMAALVANWARFGAETARTAQTLGVSSGQLQGLRGAAELAGVATGDLDSGLKSMGTTLQDALYGRNQSALLMLNRLGIGVHRTAAGAVDSVRAFRELSGVIQRIRSPQVQSLVAQQFGVEALLPLLRQGPAAIDAYQRKVASLGGVMSDKALKAADDLRNSITMLDIALHGMLYGTLERIAPVLQPLIEKWALWIAANHDLVATKAEKFVEGLAHWLDNVNLDKFLDGLSKGIDKLDKFAQSIGGWENMALGLVALVNNSMITSLAALSLSLVALAAGPLKNVLVGLAGIAGGPMGATIALGTMAASMLLGPGIDALITAVTGKDASLGTWLHDLLNPSNANEPRGIRNNNPGNLRSWAGAGSADGFAKFNTPEAGLSAMAKQLQIYGQRGINSLDKIIAKWAPSADGNNVRSYIDSVSKATGFQSNEQLNLSDTNTLVALMKAMIRVENGKQPYSDQMLQGAAQRVVVDVNLRGAPAGTTTTVRGGASARVQHSMPAAMGAN